MTVNRDLGVQRIDNIDIRTLSTGRYYTMNSTNLPTGWVAAYLDVERLDAEWCRITAWPPYADISSPQIIKCSLGVWGNWNSITTTSDFATVDCSVLTVANTVREIPGAPKSGNWLAKVIVHESTLGCIENIMNYGETWHIYSTVAQRVLIRFFKYPM
mgnify:CR=1 FL=1